MRNRLIAVLIAGVVVLAACGDDSETTSTTEAAGGSSEPSAEPEVTSADTELGEVLVDADGFTLYGFTPDADAGGMPTCVDECAEAWPVVSVDGPDLPEGLDAAVFTVVERPDGEFQLKAGSFPLYRFAADDAAGDINGQGVGDVWFAVAPNGSLLENDASTVSDTVVGVY